MSVKIFYMYISFFMFSWVNIFIDDTTIEKLYFTCVKKQNNNQQNWELTLSTHFLQ